MRDEQVNPIRWLWARVGDISLIQWLVTLPTTAAGIVLLSWFQELPWALWVIFTIAAVIFAMAPIILINEVSGFWTGANVLRINGIELLRDSPNRGQTEVFIVVENCSPRPANGVLAQLVDAVPPLQPQLEHCRAFGLPLSLATKSRLDRQRATDDLLPVGRFNLGPYEQKHVGVLWLDTGQAEIAFTAHEGGNAIYLFWFDQMLEVRVSGIGKPATTRLLITKTNQESHAWDIRQMAQGDQPPNADPYGQAP